MKVLFLLGGMPHYLSTVFNNIQKSGIDVLVVLPEAKGKTLGKGVKEDYSNIGFKIIRTPEYKTWYQKPFFKNFKEIINTEKPDIVVAGWPYILAFIAYPSMHFAFKKNKTKLVLREIPFWVAPFNKPVQFYKENPAFDEDMKYQKTTGLKFYLSSLFLALVRKMYYSVSQATLNYAPVALEVQPSYGVKKNRIFVTLNSVDTNELFKVKQELEKEDIPVIPYRLIHVGRLVKWKRVDLLVDALSIICKTYPTASLSIVGDGPELENIKKQVNNLGLENNVIFEGPIYKYDALGKLFMQSSVYALAGMGGLSINEAMAFGKPVVCSVCDGTEKVLVRDGKNGYYFENGNSKSLADKIMSIIGHDEVQASMGKESERIIKDEVNIDVVCNNFISALRTIHSS